MFNLKSQWGPTRLSLVALVIMILTMIAVKDGNVSNALKSLPVLLIGASTAMVFLAEIKRSQK